MSEKSILSTDWMQMTGKHYMGVNLKSDDIDNKKLKTLSENAMAEQMKIVDRWMDEDKDVKPTNDKIIVPTAGRIVVLPYDKNPYRVPLHKAESGLIVGADVNGSRFKNPDSGEVEERQKGIWCCKVIAVGPECKSVLEDEDVYINMTIASPLPFGDKGYYSISENNVICSIRKK